MSAPKYAMGPWKVVKHANWLSINSADGLFIVEVEPVEKPFIDRKAANAALIAAAPELYDMVEELSNYLDEKGLLRDQELIIKADRLRAKARGEQ
jgi:hypothetical protein